jgi:hypothetical protein
MSGFWANDVESVGLVWVYLAEEAEMLHAQRCTGQQGTSDVGSVLEVCELCQHDGHVVRTRQSGHLEHLCRFLVHAPC